MTEVDNPSLPGLLYSDLDGSATANIGSATSWTAWDLSALVPAGTRAVLVSGGSNGFASRATGSGLNRQNVVGKSQQMCQVSAARSIDILNSALGPDLFYLMGYWS